MDSAFSRRDLAFVLLPLLLFLIAGCGSSSTRRHEDAGRPDSSTTTDDSSTVVEDAQADTDSSSTCVPVSATELVCDGKDDDCNGRIDDVDIGNDGICDCLRIGVLGTPGPNTSSSFQAWLIARGSSVVRIHDDTANAPELTLAALLQFDVVVLDRLVRLYTEAEAQILTDWVASGGGVMSMTGYTAQEPSWARPNSLLIFIGIQYIGAPLLNGPVTDFEPHPITTGLTSVTFLGGFEVTSDGSADTTDMVVASLNTPDPTPVGIVQERGQGRVFVWGDEWIEYDSEWNTLPEITQLWVNVFAWLGPRNTCQIVVR